MTRNKLFIILIGCLILAGGIFYLTVERNNDNGAVAWNEANWSGVSDADADSLPENELTIEKIQQKANEEREANLICNSLKLDKNDIETDLKALSAEEIDKDVGSAGERGILSVKQMENALLIGTNSRGCMLGDGSYTYTLPNSKLGVTVGNKAFVEGNCSSDIEGLGWMPDIYVDGYLALDRTIKMFRYYNLEPDDGVQALPTWGEKINRFESLGES